MLSPLRNIYFLRLLALATIAAASPLAVPTAAPTGSATTTSTSASITSVPETTTISSSRTSTAPTPSPVEPTRISFVDPEDAALLEDLGELKPRVPEPTDCANSGYGNTGCNNSGIDNSGTNNSGIGNCGTNHSGVGEGCGDDDSGTTTGQVVTAGATATAVGDEGGYTTTLTGPTSTVTVVVDGEHRRVDCAYWEAQGFVCAGASGRGLEKGVVMAVVGVAATVGAWLVI